MRIWTTQKKEIEIIIESFLDEAEIEIDNLEMSLFVRDLFVDTTASNRVNVDELVEALMSNIRRN